MRARGETPPSTPDRRLGVVWSKMNARLEKGVTPATNVLESIDRIPFFPHLGDGAFALFLFFLSPALSRSRTRTRSSSAVLPLVHADRQTARSADYCRCTHGHLSSDTFLRILFAGRHCDIESNTECRPSPLAVIKEKRLRFTAESIARTSHDVYVHKRTNGVVRASKSDFRNSTS